MYLILYPILLGQYSFQLNEMFHSEILLIFDCNDARLTSIADYFFQPLDFWFHEFLKKPEKIEIIEK